MDIQEKIRLNEILQDAARAAVTGHTNPDGDCIGSCLGLWHYLREHFPRIECTVFLDGVPERFRIISGTEQIRSEVSSEAFDVVFCLDCSTMDRLGKFAVLKKQAAKTVCIDHHVFSGQFCDIDYVDSAASSASELVCDLLGTQNLSEDAACALYMGIAHDTGVFRYPCTDAKTMRTAADLLAQGIPFSSILEQTYYKKTYEQTRILSRALLDARAFFDGKVMASIVDRKEMKLFHVGKGDLDSIAPSLRDIAGAEASIFIYPVAGSLYKVSLRSSDSVNVREIASRFGGGGHVRAAGCSMTGTPEEILNRLLEQFALQLDPEAALEPADEVIEENTVSS